MSDELIKTTINIIGGREVNSVNMRDVFEFIVSPDSGTKFADWAKIRLKRAKINNDYTFIRVATNNLRGGRPQTDYIVTLDLAKSICMLEDNEKGDELRQYFIDCEKKLLDITPSTTLSPELTLFKTMLDSAIALETKQKALEKRTEAIELKLEATISKDEECLNSTQIQHLEALFKQAFDKTGSGRQIGQIKKMLKMQFLTCPASGCTYKDIAQKHYPACVKIISSFL